MTAVSLLFACELPFLFSVSFGRNEEVLPCVSDDHPCRGRSVCLGQHERPKLRGGSCCVICIRAGTFVQVLCLIGSDHFVSYSVFCVCGAASLCDLFPKRSDEEKGT